LPKRRFGDGEGLGVSPDSYNQNAAANSSRDP
jgi:hypothetical protein